MTTPAVTENDSALPAAILRLLRRLDWGDTTLDGPRYQLAQLRGLLASFCEQDVSADVVAAMVDAIGDGYGPRFAPDAADWVGAQ